MKFLVLNELCTSLSPYDEHDGIQTSNKGTKMENHLNFSKKK